MVAAEEVKVLLVDDEQDFIRLLAERLETRGLKVKAVPGGPEAIEKVKEESFDAIILDFLMPEMNGIETLKHLKKINPDLQIILLTGYGSIEKGIEAMKLGAMDFLEKPADFKKIMEKIDEAKHQKMLLVEKRHENKMKEILQKRGW